MALLAMIDAYGPGYPNFGSRARRVASHLGNLLRLAPREKVEYARTRADAVRRLAARRLWNVADRTLERVGRQMPETLENMEGAHYLKVSRAYEIRPYPGRVTVFRARQQPVGAETDPYLGWGSVVGGGVDVYEVPGGHESLILEPNVAALAKALQTAIERACVYAQT